MSSFFSAHCFLLLSSYLLALPNLALSIGAGTNALASQYSLTTTTSFPFPTATLSSSDAQSYVVSKWSLGKGRVQDGPDNLAFTTDPLAMTPGPVLRVTYPKGSYSRGTGGAQFINLWNTSNDQPLQSMMLSYEVAFDKDFDWVKGGKLPGLRGGPNSTGCSGGNQPTGSDCFSTRLMWRKDGAGEVYAYMRSPNNLCKESSITCNSDFGISVSRGSFIFAAGQWNRVTLVVQMNNPPDVANGNLQLYVNNLQVISQQDLQFRTSTQVNINGLYFSTFFGGSDDSWSTPVDTHTYFRNMTLWGSSGPSTLSGQKVKSSATTPMVQIFSTFPVAIGHVYKRIEYVLYFVSSVRELPAIAYRSAGKIKAVFTRLLKMRPPSPSIPEKEFLFSALKQSLRLDGRLPLEMRSPEITFSEELGTVECALGKTRVLANLDAKMVKPPPERPFEGFITIHSELSPMASSEYELGRPSEEEVTITRMLDKVIRRSDTVDKESLCILAGQRVWHLRLTIHCLADSGNLLDCACLAGLVALKHFRRPEVEVIGDEVTVHPSTSRAPLPLSLHHTPYCFTFAFFNDADIPIILDPNQLEQRLSGGLMSIALNAQRELCVVQKSGGVPLAPDDVLKIVNVAVDRAKELDALVEARLREDWEGRKIEVE
ncbi:3'-5'-exoribonuclease [Marasmius crinis-equi]|uniref:3'-5'-exoribonuclease n=1 Tax=Marasmius crinis-equi TaxID=585013 RepID=A0ABR3FNK0_9AGAR